MAQKTIKKKSSKQTFKVFQGFRRIALILIIGGLLGFFSSMVLTAEKIHILKDPSYQPTCNINPLFSCGSIMRTSQADFLGLPNPLFGVVGFTVIIVSGAVLLFGARMNRTYWRLLLAGSLVGLAGLAYLFYQSLYVLKTLCVYCMSVWAITIFLSWYLLLWNKEQGFIAIPKRLQRSFEFLHRHHIDVLIAAYLILAAVVIGRFWYYFGPIFQNLV